MADMQLNLMVRAMFGGQAQKVLDRLAALERQQLRTTKETTKETQRGAKAKERTRAIVERELAAVQKKLTFEKQVSALLRQEKKLKSELKLFDQTRNSFARKTANEERRITRELQKQQALARQGAAHAFRRSLSPIAPADPRGQNFTGGAILPLDFRAAQMGKAIKNATGQMQGFTAETQKAHRASNFLFDVLQAFLLYKGFVFIKTQLQEFVRELIDAQHEIAIVQTQLNHTGRDFQPVIREEILKVAQETGLAMSALAKAEFEVVSANIDVADSFGILELAAKAAVAGGLQDVELAFNAALSQVNAFRLANEDFDDVFDKQFNLVKRGIFTYEQFATVVGTVSASFAAMGQDIDTANASLAAVSQIFTGKQIERGATGLRNAITKMGQNAHKFKELGIDVEDEDGNFRNILDVMRDLEAVLDGMTEGERLRTIKSLFQDIRAVRGVNALLTQLDEAEAFLVEQKLALGDLDEAYQTVSESVKIQADVFKNDLIPAAEPLVDIMDVFLRTMNGIDEGLPGFTRNITTLAVAITGLSAALFMLNGAAANGFFGAGVQGRFQQGRGGFGGGFRALPRAGQVGLIGGVGILGAGVAVGAGRKPGTSSTDLGGTLLGGAATGALFGSPGGLGGAAVGALVGTAAAGIAFAIGESLEREAEPTADAFTKAFSSALASNSGDMTQALLDAIKAELGGATGGGPPPATFKRDTGLTVSRPHTGFGVPFLRPLFRQFDKEETLFETVDALTEGMIALEAARAAEQSIDREAIKNQILALLPPGHDVSERQLESAADAQIRRGATVAAEAKLSPENAVMQDMLSQILALDEHAQRVEALNILYREGATEATQFIGTMRGLNGTIDETGSVFNQLISNAQEFLGGADFTQAADFFETLGGRGLELANEFREAAQIMRAINLMEAIKGVFPENIQERIASSLVKKLSKSTGTVFNANVFEMMPEFAQDAQIEGFVQGLLNFTEPLASASETLDPFEDALRDVTNALSALDLQARQIEMGAKLQQRELTAEEHDRLRRIEASKLGLEVGGHNMGVLQTFNNALGTAAINVSDLASAATDSAMAQKSYEEQIRSMMVGDASMAGVSPIAMQRGLNSRFQSGVADYGFISSGHGIDGVRLHDRLKGGLRVPGGGFPGDLAHQFFTAIERMGREGNRRGAVEINFLGPTTPSMVDQAAQRLAQEGWLHARQRRRVRGASL